MRLYCVFALDFLVSVLFVKRLLVGFIFYWLWVNITVFTCLCCVCSLLVMRLVSILLCLLFVFAALAWFVMGRALYFGSEYLFGVLIICELVADMGSGLFTDLFLLCLGLVSWLGFILAALLVVVCLLVYYVWVAIKFVVVCVLIWWCFTGLLCVDCWLVGFVVY